jgi:RNA 3'-terminal phosphate cyclase (ATP)/RNA 3'-terminal phosphate cyclase (GTP)
MIKVDGSYLEGGGQILRTAISLSAISQEPCHVFNIRKKRKKPGLKAQHLLGARALAELCKGRLEGDFINSEEIKFYPGQDYRERISINIPTAGSIALVLQTLISPSLFSRKPIEITFNGGATDTFFSPTIDHFQYCLLEILRGMGIRTEINILKRGYYPEGGAEVKTTIYPGKPKPINLLERGQLKEILIFSGASEFLKEKKVAERQVFGVKEVLGKLKLPLKERVGYYSTKCPGSQICLVAKFTNTIIGTDNLGKLGKRAEDVGKEAALALLNEQKSGACLDKRLADQILPFVALASGQSKVTVSEITNHCKANVWVIEKFLDGKFKIEGGLITWSSK